MKIDKDDIGRKLYTARDSLRMQGFDDKLERIVEETRRSLMSGDFKALSEDELEMVAGGFTPFKDENEQLKENTP